MSAAPSNPLDPKRILQLVARYKDRVAELEAERHEPIAIIGAGCRLPGGARSPEAFWGLLARGGDAVTAIPPTRWDADAHFDPDPERAGKAYVREGAFLAEPPDGFDAAFFGLSPREAASLDPQHRLLLEVAWEALEDAAVAPQPGAAAGVFVGMGPSDYDELQRTTLRPDEHGAYNVTGTHASFAAGRISYVLGFEGPSVCVDTACSSSLVALHLACQSLRLGECSVALAGSVQLLLSPFEFMRLSRMRALARDGRCKAFSAEADGYGRGEGCVMFALKRLRDARRDGDRILAVVRGSAVNHDGRSSGLTAPNGVAQQGVIRRALADAGLSPADVDYVEAHGTGTVLGDPIEIEALAAVYGEGRDEGRPLLVGSVKTNIGHLESASGAAGLLKVVLALGHQSIPEHLHARTLNPHVAWDRLPIVVTRSAHPFRADGRPRRAGVSAFGMSGTNAHLIVEEAPPDEVAFADAKREGAWVLPLSAKSQEALRTRAAELSAYLDTSPRAALADVGFTAAIGRSHFRIRHAVVAETKAEAAGALAAFARGAAATEGAPSEVGSTRPRLVAFLFTGQGSQYIGMGRALDEGEPVFHEAISRCEELLRPRLPHALRDVLYGAPACPAALDETGYTQPALFAVAYALTALWASWGVRPDVVAGHSVGEIAAACVAGVFSLEDGLALITARAAGMQALPAGGAMISLAVDEERAKAALAPYGERAALAAINGPRQVVIAGEDAAVVAIAAGFAREGARTKRLPVSHAFHSPLMRPMVPAFARAAAAIRYAAPAIPIVSALDPALDGGALARAEHWVRHVEAEVRFDAALTALAARGVTTYVEIGPHPALLALTAERAGGAERPALVASLRRVRDDVRSLASSLAELYGDGADIDWQGVYAKARPRRVALPTYPFQRQRYWFTDRRATLPVPTTVAAPPEGRYALSGEPSAAPGAPLRFLLEIGVTRQPYLADHIVHGRVVVPGAFHIAAVIAIAASHLGASTVTLRDVEFQRALVLADDMSLQFTLAPRADGGFAFTVETPSDVGLAAPREHAAGTLLLEAEPAGASVVFDERGAMEPRSVSSLLASLTSAEIAWGPRWIWPTDIEAAEAGARARLAPPEGTNAAEAPLHPALIDNAFAVGVLPAFTVDAAQGTRGAPYLPWGISAFRWYGRNEKGAAIARGRIAPRASEDSETLTCDVTLVADDGGVLADIEGFVCKRAPREAFLHERASELEAELFTLAWRPAAASLADEPAVERRGGLLVCADDEARVAALGARLSREGVAWTGVVIASGVAATPASVRRVDPTTPEALAELLASAPWPLEAVVGWWSRDERAASSAPDEAPARAALHLAQALVHASAERERAASPQLVWVTEGAQAALPGERVALSLAPIWGLGRVLMQEHPELRPMLLDLARDAVAPADAIWRELSLSGDARQIALREGQRLAPELAPLPAATAAPPAIAAGSTVLITGGLGALGLHVARWLVRSHRVQHLVLASRRAPTAEQLAAVEALRAGGANVTTVEADVADYEGVARLLAALPQEPKLRGIVHAAGALEDGVITAQNAAQLSATMAPKARGAWNLHAQTSHLPLDFFVLFSSAASLLGPAGQGSYAAANALLDGLAHERRALSLPALSVNWGPWAEGGMASRLSVAAWARLARQGIGQISPARAMALFERAIARPEAQLAALSFDASAPEADVTPILRPRARPERARAAVAPAVSWAAALRALDEGARAAQVEAGVRADVARVLSMPEAGSIAGDQPLRDLGLDSLMSVELRNLLAARLGEALPVSLVFDYPSVAALTRHLLARIAAAPARALAPAARPLPEASAAEPIAIVGASCRFPGGVRDLETLWRALEQGHDAICEVPPERWDVDAYYDPDPDAPGTMMTRSGGFLDGIDRFDAPFFGISRREAEKMDPQQRLLLEAAWEAIERAGIPATRLMGSDAGVFVGLMYHDYEALLSAPEQLDGYASTGSAASVASGRISYLLGTHGPSMTVDTACSSSLVAIHLACQSLLRGECGLALAGGVAVMLRPNVFIDFSRLRGLAPDGRCKSFDASADGVGWSEGCAMIALKRLSDAARDGDPILALIRGSAVNQDGRSNGLTAPNGPSQAAVIKRALAQARVSADDVDYVEAHGTGTPLGDPIEVEALGAVFGRARRPGSARLRIGSIKANFGHTQAAAGVAGVLKAALALASERIPGTPHLRAPSPRVSWSDLGVEAVAAGVPWPRGASPRYAGVSSFGISGTNAHLVLEEAPQPRGAPRGTLRSSYFVPLSAKSPEALSNLARAYAGFLASHPDARLHDIAFTASARRSHHPLRLAIVADSIAELSRALADLASGEPHPAARRGAALVDRPPRLVLVFPGQGAQWAGMGRDLAEEEPLFRSTLAVCDALMRKHGGLSLLDELEKTDDVSGLAAGAFADPALLAVEIALAALLRSWGVVPDAVIGHGVGEIAAAHVAGALDLEQAVRLAVLRGGTAEGAAEHGVSVALGEHALGARIAEARAPVRVAELNDPGSSVLAGEAAALDALVASLTAVGVACRSLPARYAAPGAALTEASAALALARGARSPAALQIPMYSTVTGAHVSAEELTASHWANSLRSTVRFSDAVSAALADEAMIFLEVGPHPALSGHVEACVAARGGEGRAVGTLHRHRGSTRALQEALAALYAQGCLPNLSPLYPDRGLVLPLPTYPFQRQRYWINAPHPGARERGLAAWGIDDGFYAIVWQPAARPPPRVATPKRWLVIADGGGVGEALAAVLRARGDVCELLPADEAAARPSWLDAQLDEPLPLHAVVDLGSLDAPDGADVTLDAVEGAALASCASMIDLVRRLAGRAEAARLWVVTRGAERAVEGDAVSVARAPLWGLGRVAALERPELWGGLVDLAPGGEPDEIARLAEILAEPTSEDQLALRGGLALAPRIVPRPVPRSPRALTLDPDRAYLITGGLGEIGLAAARWLVDRGATHVVLTSRGGLPERTRWDDEPSAAIRGRIAAVRALEARGARVYVAALDAGDPESFAGLVARLERPIGGVIHAAGTGTLTRLDAEVSADALAEAFRAKVRGTWIMHTALAEAPLAFMVLLSSVSAIWGGAGQGHYAAANHFMGAVAHARALRGLPALCVDLGAVRGGMLTDEIEAAFEAAGVHALSVEQVTEALERAIVAQVPRVVFARVDWPRFKQVYEARRPRPLLYAVVPDDEARRREAEVRPHRPAPRALAAIRAAGAMERRILLEALLREALAAILRVPPDAVDLSVSLVALGMDSLGVIELRQRLHDGLGLRVTAAEIWAQERADRLALHIGQQLDASEPTSGDVSAGVARAPAPPGEGGAAGRWIVVPRPVQAPAARLFCFPYAGGGAPIFSDWWKELPAPIEVIAMAPPGRHAREREPAASSIEELVAGALPAMLPYLDRPFALFGHCLGAIVMFELARKLRDELGLAPVHLFASGAPPPRRYLLPNVTLHGQERLVELLRFIGFARPAVLADPRAMSELLPPVIADFDVAAAYRCSPGSALEVPITTFAAKDDAFAPPAVVDGWREETTQAFASICYSGEHYFLVPERPSMTRVIGEAMCNHLAVAERRSSAWAPLPAAPPRAPRLVPFRQRPRARRALVCFHGAGGEAALFRSFPSALPEDTDVFAVELPGRGARADELPLGRFEDIVEEATAAALEHEHRAFTFFGHDLGALVMFEVARHLRALSLPGPSRLLVSASSAPHVYFFPPLHHLPTERFLETLRLMGASWDEGVSERRLRADFGGMATFAYRHEPALDVPIVALMGTRDDFIPRQGLRAWSEQTKGSFALHVVEGDHAFFRGEHSPLLQLLRDLVVGGDAQGP